MTLSELANMTRASQDKFELEQLLRILSYINPLSILEVGVFLGGFVETMRKAFPNATVIGIDKDYSSLEFTDFYALSGDSHLPSMREAVKDTLKGKPLDFLFIDGDHTYNGVKTDFELYAPLVRSGGIIAFHDTMRLSGQIKGVEVREFFDHIRSSCPSIELWNSPLGDIAPGIGVLFV